MANFDNDQQNYWNVPPNQGAPSPNQDFNFEMPDQFGQELNFQTFDASSQQSNAPLNYTQPTYPVNQAPFFDPMQAYGQPDINQPKSYEGNEFEDEPPLLEELGINPQHILMKTLSVLNPFRTPEKEIFDDTDLAGPLVFCMAFGGFLLLVSSSCLNIKRNS
ncbi:hypothetical protein ACKWTF_002250 [Chironomus riparius]